MISDPTKFEKQTNQSIKTPSPSSYTEKPCSIQYSIKYSDFLCTAAAKDYKAHHSADL